MEVRDEEIIKALEYCLAQGITSECERCRDKIGCRDTLLGDALDLIRHQKAEKKEIEFELIRSRNELKGWKIRALGYKEKNSKLERKNSELEIELKAMRGAANSCRECSSFECTEELTDYLLANGIIVPPCKVGQTVYRATKLVNGDEFVTEGIILEISSTYENGTAKTRFYFWAKGDEWTSRNHSLWCDLTEFGKTVFLTKEEAEKALVNYESSKIEKGGKER